MIPPEVQTVARLSPDEVVLTFTPSRDHPAFADHFPGQPILPGVVQLDWAVQLGDAYLGVGQPAATDFQVKFQRLFEPGPDLSLLLKFDRAKAALNFEYRTGAVTVSSGRIKVAPPL